MADEWGEMIALSDTVKAIRQQRKPSTRKAGKKTQKRGDDGEKLARRWLNKRFVGFLAGDKVNREKTSFNGRWSTKARADFSGVERGTGKMMLCEVKAITSDRLQWSALRKHQTANLDRLNEWGGVSLLIIVKDGETAVLSWPVDGFKKGTSILWEDAMENRVN